jgi:iron complex transport system substrate-binding protein
VAVDAVVAAMPDAVVIAWCGVQSRNYRPEQVYRRAGWEQVPAVSNLRVRAVPEAYLGRPGPRLAAGLHALESLVAEFAAPPALPRAD